MENLLLKSIDHQVSVCKSSSSSKINLIKKDYFADVRIDGPQNKLNVHAQEFQMARGGGGGVAGEHLQNSRSSIAVFPTNHQPHQQHSPAMLQHSKSSGNMQQQLQLSAARQHAVQMANMSNGQRAILMSHPMALGPIGVGVAMQSSQMPLVNSPSSGNLLHVSNKKKIFSIQIIIILLYYF